MELGKAALVLGRDPFWVSLELFCVWDCLVKMPTLDESVKNLKYFRREKILPYKKQCKNKTSLIFAVYPQEPKSRAGQHGCAVSTSEIPFHSVFWRVTIMKFQTIILTPRYKYNLIFQGDHREDMQMFMMWFVCDLYSLEIRASPTCDFHVIFVSPPIITDILLILQISKFDAKILRHINCGHGINLTSWKWLCPALRCQESVPRKDGKY